MTDRFRRNTQELVRALYVGYQNNTRGAQLCLRIRFFQIQSAHLCSFTAADPLLADSLRSVRQQGTDKMPLSGPFGRILPRLTPSLAMIGLETSLASLA